MPEGWYTGVRGTLSDETVTQALRQNGITSIEQLVREAVSHAQRETADSGGEADFWIAYNNGKWGLCGPDQV